MGINKPEFHDKIWGEEEWIVNNNLYCGKILRVNKGYQCSYHCHKVKTETFYILKGIARMKVDGKVFKMYEGEVIDIPIGMYHRFTGITGVEILEVSTQHFEDDSYRITKGGKSEY